MRLVDKVSIITGAGSGIGHATAVKFAREGAKVAVCDINETSAHKVAKEINDDGGEAIHFHVDVTDKESIARMVDAPVTHVVAREARAPSDMSFA